jgi:hypothetical protein
MVDSTIGSDRAAWADKRVKNDDWPVLNPGNVLGLRFLSDAPGASVQRSSQSGWI